jgi:hypothetical protein
MALCFEEGSKCYNFLTCKKTEEIIDQDSKKKVSIEVVHDSKKIQHDSDDVNSESDSGVGSVRTTGTEGDSAIESGKESIKKPQVKTISAKVNRVKSVKRSESLLSRFSFIFPQETEKLADILVEEFKKNDQSNGLAMERMFRKADPSALVEASNKKIKKKKSFKQLILGKGDVQPLPKVEETKETEATSDDVKEIGKSDLVDSSSPDLNMANREKKKRKKRRQQRKPTDGQADDSSSLSSNQDEPVPARPTQLANQKTEPATTNQNTVGKVANQEQSPSPNVAIVEFKNEEINK